MFTTWLPFAAQIELFPMKRGESIGFVTLHIGVHNLQLQFDRMRSHEVLKVKICAKILQAPSTQKL